MRYVAEQQIRQRRVKDLISSFATTIAVRYEVPVTIPIIIQERDTIYFGSFCVDKKARKFKVKGGVTGLRKGPTPMQLVDDLLEYVKRREDLPETVPTLPIICDEETARQLAKYSLSILVDGTNRRLLIRRDGFLDVYAR